MALSRAQLLKELVPGLNALFGLEYKTYEDEHKMLFDEDSSEKAFEEEVKLAGFGMAPSKAEGSAISYDQGQEAWVARYQHETIALGFAITEEAIEDQLYDSLSARYTKALARSMAYTKQIKGANIINNGFSTGTGGDGKTLFATDHPLTGGGTISNRPTTGVDLNETALEAAVIAIAAWVDERGLLLAARPRKLVIPPAYMFVAERVLKSPARVSTANNDLNALKTMGMIPEGYGVNHFITDTNSWYLKTDIPNGLKFFQRVAIKTGTEGDFDTGNVRYKARERYSFGWSDPLGVYGSPGST